MKKILLATTVLVGTAGFAAAEVTLSGDARMGIVNDGTDTSFSSRARVAFSLSGETDGGLSFGASFRADNASSGALTEDGVESGADNGTAGTVFISGAFGKISMGDNDSAAHTAVGQVAGVGYTGNGDLNEVAYLDDDAESVLYTYSAGDLSVMASLGQIGGADDQQSLAVAYTMGDYSFAAGVESHSDVADTHVIVGGSAKFGAVSVKGIYGQLGDADQYALSATYTADALSATVFTRSSFADVQANGVGVSYDLGGGASVASGYSKADGADGVFDAGVTFSF